MRSFKAYALASLTFLLLALLAPAGAQLSDAGFQTAQLSSTGAGKKVSGGAGTISTVYTVAIAGSDDGNSDANTTFRIVIPATNLTSPSGTPTTFRATITWGASSPTETGALQALYCGRGAPTGNAYSFANPPTQIKFGGGNTANSSAGGVVLSDFVTLPESFDVTKPFVCSFFINVGSAAHLAEGTAAGSVEWDFKSGNDASTQTASGYSTISFTQTGVMVSKIETQ